jgi:pimeloyl-ACP methyl ester carboxylesterase
MIPETRYARSGDLSIAYQVVGDGPFDLVHVPGWVSNIEMMWEEPSYARFLGRLASFSRLLLFDKRGTGLSDRVPDDRLPMLEERMDDVRAVMDAAGSDRGTVRHVRGRQHERAVRRHVPESNRRPRHARDLREAGVVGRLSVGSAAG